MKYYQTEIKKIVDTMAGTPLFLTGTIQSIANEISVRGYDKTKDGTTYPCVLLSSESQENRNPSDVSSIEVDVLMYFVVETDPNRSDLECLEHSFVERIEPFMSEFFTKLQYSNSFVFDNNARFETIDNIPMQTITLTKKTFFNDVVDALQVNITLKIRK